MKFLSKQRLTKHAIGEILKMKNGGMLGVKNKIIKCVAIMGIMAGCLGMSGCVKRVDKIMEQTQESQKLLNEGPHQGATTEIPFEWRGALMEPQAQYKIVARVLRKEKYRWDKASQYSSWDFALGWGWMADPQEVHEQVKINQGGRFYYYKVKDRNPSDVGLWSANTHMIANQDSINESLDRISEGDLVMIEGWLINVTDPKNAWQWKTSLTREDAGDGACEIVFIKSITKVKDPYGRQEN